MTMRLDIVTNDAGELVRREHARELGAGVVVAVYRLAKLAQMHDLKNQAFLQQLETAHQVIGEYCLRAGLHVKMLFAERAIFVAGQLLKGTRQTYEQAAELGEMVDHMGGSELAIQRDITVAELRAFAESIALALRSPRGTFESPTPKVQLRAVADAARLRGLEVENLPAEARIVRTYASAVVILRRFFDDLHESKYVLPRRIKRVAQSLVDLSEGETLAFLGVTEARNANHDEAGRAVNAAILAVAMAREVTQTRSVLAQIAMASMMHDVARPRALAAMNADASDFTAQATALSEEQEDQLAGAAAAVLTALGRVNEPSITRTVITFEALWLRRQQWIGAAYRGTKLPTLHARIMWIARRYNDLLTPDPGLAAPSQEAVIGALAGELREPQDRDVLRLLVSALGIVPKGTQVQLTTGEVGEVIRTTCGQGDGPEVAVQVDADGLLLSTPRVVDLGEFRAGAPTIARVLSIDGWVSGARSPAIEHVVQASSDDRASDDRAEYEASDVVGRIGDERPVLALSDPLAARVANVAPAGHVGHADDAGTRPSDEGAPMPTARSSRPEPSARGTLAQTPVPHVLVYMIDHELTGSVVFANPNGTEHIAYFSHGVPTKVRLAGGEHRLGAILANARAITSEDADEVAVSARRSATMFGEALVASGLVSKDVLEVALADQLLKRMVVLANVGDPWTYSFYRDFDALEAWGTTTPVTPSPFDAILACVRAWTDRERVTATLTRLAKHPLKLHADADAATMMLSTAEVAVFHRIATESPVTKTLWRAEDGTDLVASLVYALAVTRQFEFKGQKKGPMAPRGSRPQRERRPARIARGSMVARKRAKAPSNRPSAVSSPPRSSFPKVSVPAPRQAAIASGQSVAPGGEPLAEAMSCARLADAALQQEDYAAAEKHAQRAVQLDAKQPEYKAILAWAKAQKQGDKRAKEVAIFTMSASLRQDPQNVRVLLYRGRLYRDVGNDRLAIKDFEDIVTQDPTHREALEALRELGLVR